jgi:hypothetical protein
MVPDTANTESADEQVDAGKAVSDQIGCATAFLFFGISALLSGLVLANMVI